MGLARPSVKPASVGQWLAVVRRVHNRRRKTSHGLWNGAFLSRKTSPGLCMSMGLMYMINGGPATST